MDKALLRFFKYVSILFFVTSCANFEQELAKDILITHNTPLNRCEVEGFSYSGIESGLTKPEVLKVLMVHGVGTHFPGYSRRIQENIAAAAGLNVLSRLPKNIYLRDPAEPQKSIGNLRVTYWQNADGSKKMLFYELTWSEITMPDKQLIAFDTTEQYSKFRVPFNNSMKVFLDNVLPDPLAFESPQGEQILTAGMQSLCWLLTTDWKTIPDNRAKVCFLSQSEEIQQFDKQNMLFITHSLGSQILMDTIVRTADNVAATVTNPDPDLRSAVRRLQNKELTVFMLANQLPILQIGHPLPRVHNQIASYCAPKGEKYRQRVFKAVNIVAFSDPNDLLSYAIPQSFADKYIDSRLCPLVTNVSVNVAPEISAFGVGIVNPIAAHTDYDKSPKVIELISRGTVDFNHDSPLDRQCRFILLKKDRSMK